MQPGSLESAPAGTRWLSLVGTPTLEVGPCGVPVNGLLPSEASTLRSHSGPPVSMCRGRSPGAPVQKRHHLICPHVCGHPAPTTRVPHPSVGGSETCSPASSRGCKPLHLSVWLAARPANGPASPAVTELLSDFILQAPENQLFMRCLPETFQAQ